MSEKRYRQIRRKRKELQVEWLKTLVTDEEAKKVSIQSIETLVPQRDYIMKNHTTYHSFMTNKWIEKYLKKYPEINSYAELEKLYNNQRNIHGRQRILS
tara:strand:- start:518 stop:814 length:297 start_codon:yes stop_codon:yes gene_type:complete